MSRTAPVPLNPAVTSISAMFPCYNDARTIGGLVKTVADSLAELNVDYEIVVVDDASSDDSVAVLQALQGDYPMLQVIEHETNQGYGGALRSGFAAATKEWVFYTDGDGQYDPSEVGLLVQKATETVDFVQGFKLRRGDSWYRKLIGFMYHHLMRILFRLDMRDIDCDFRLIRRSLLDRVRLQRSSGVICVEMMRKFTDAGAHFAEVPVHHYFRPHGRSQFFRLPHLVAVGVDIVRLWFELIVLRRGIAGG